MMQVDNLETFLTWVKSSPCQFTISSMSGGYVHVKFLIPFAEEIETDRKRVDRIVGEVWDKMQDPNYAPPESDNPAHPYPEGK